MNVNKAFRISHNLANAIIFIMAMSNLEILNNIVTNNSASNICSYCS